MSKLAQENKISGSQWSRVNLGKVVGSLGGKVDSRGSTSLGRQSSLAKHATLTATISLSLSTLVL
jgi:hypothetical protein